MKLLLRLFAAGRRKEQREAIERVADDPKLTAKVRAFVIDLHEKRTGKKLGKIGDGELLKLFLQYAPQIMAFIMQLIAVIPK